MANLKATSVSGAMTISGGGRIIANNTPKGTVSIGTAGSYVWSTILNDYYTANGFFESRRLYRFIMQSSNGAHFHAYMGWINTGDLSTGSASTRFVVRDISAVHSGWQGGCAGNPWTSIDSTGFTYYINPCFESIAMTVEDLG
jgi:hypothetical protein